MKVVLTEAYRVGTIITKMYKLPKQQHLPDEPDAMYDEVKLEYNLDDSHCEIIPVLKNHVEESTVLKRVFIDRDEHDMYTQKVDKYALEELFDRTVPITLSRAMEIALEEEFEDF